MNTSKVRKLKNATDWKDRLAGWATWRVEIPACRECGTAPAFIKVDGTRADALKFRDTPALHYCDLCS